MGGAGLGKKPRIDDVVQMSGVSRATVDRVLNQRPGVSARTVAKVDAALATLGFAPTALASRSLAQVRSVEVLLPEGLNPFFGEIQKGFDAAARAAARTGCIVRFHGFDPYRPETLLAALRGLDDSDAAIVITGVDTDSIAAEIRRIVRRGTRVVTVVSDVTDSGRSVYVGQDNFMAGRTAGRLMSGLVDRGPGSVAVLLGHLQFRHLLDRQSGFLQIIGLMRPDLTLQPTRPYGNDPSGAKDIVETLIDRHPDLKGVYLAGGGQPSVIEALSGLKSRSVVTIAHEVNPISRSALESGCLTAILGHDIREVGRKALDAALGIDVGDGLCGINIYLQDNLPKP
jgi:LacI family transcriptional regulator